MAYPGKVSTDPNNLMNGEREIGISWTDFSADHVARYKFAQSLLPTKARVLDVGCGVGYGTAMLAQTADEVIGIDYRQHVIQFAQQHWARPNTTYRCGNALVSSDLPSGQFDVVVAFEIIEHLPDDREFIKILANCLHPEGFLVISAPNVHGSPNLEDNPWHYRHYRTGQLRDLLQSFFTQVAEFSTVGKVVRPGVGGHSDVLVAYHTWPQRYTIGYISQEYPSGTDHHPPSGGIGTYTRTLARSLASRGHNVHVIARASDGDQNHGYVDESVNVRRVVNIKLPANRIATRLLGKITMLLSRWITVRRYIAEQINEPFDLIEAAEWCAEALFCTSLHKNTAFIVRLHSPTYVLRDASRVKPDHLVNWAEKCHAQLADSINAPSQAMANLCQRDWRLGRVDVINNPVVTLDDSPSINEKSTVVGYFPGRFDTYKGFPVLVDALQLFLEQDTSSLSFLLVGSNYIEHHLRQRLKQLSSWSSDNESCADRSHVEILARQPYHALQQLIETTDIVLIASRYENAPYAALEAMSMGKLVIAPRIGGLPEMIQSHVNGLLFDPEDAHSLASQLKWTVEHPEEVYAIRHAAHASIRESFAIDRLAATYEVYYAHVIGKKRLGEPRQRPFGWWLPFKGPLLPNWIHRAKALWHKNRTQLGTSK